MLLPLEKAPAVHRQVPRHLFHPLLVRVHGHPGEVHLPAADLDEEQDIERHQACRRDKMAFRERELAPPSAWQVVLGNEYIMPVSKEPGADAPLQRRERLGGILNHYHRHAA